MANEVFKILIEMCPPVLANLVEKRSSSYDFRYSNILQVPTVHTITFGKGSFMYVAPVLWNSLPDDLRKCSNLIKLKALFYHDGKNCNCIACNWKWDSTSQVISVCFCFNCLLWNSLLDDLRKCSNLIKLKALFYHDGKNCNCIACKWKWDSTLQVHICVFLF